MLKAWPILSLLVLALVIFTAAARALDDDSSEEEFQPGLTQPPNEEDEEQQGPVGPTQPPKQRGYHFKHHHAKWRKYDTPVIDSLSSSEVVVLPREKTLWEAFFEGWLKTTTRRLPTDDETANMDEKLGRSLMESKPRARSSGNFKDKDGDDDYDETTTSTLKKRQFSRDLLKLGHRS